MASATSLLNGNILLDGSEPKVFIIFVAKDEKHQLSVEYVFLDRRYLSNFQLVVLRRCGKRGGSVVSASDLGPERLELKPWPVHPRCVLKQNISLSQCLSPPRCISGNQQIAWGQPDKMLGGNLRWTSIL